METTFKRSADINKLNKILEKMESMHHAKDIHILLDNILSETRSFTNADAGSIFLVEDNKLKFSYVQNDSLFKNDILCNKYIYSNRKVDLNKKSIAGYVASRGEPLLIDDAYKIVKNKPYTFNSFFDEISSYKTKSMLIVPIKSHLSRISGVLELINAKNKETNQVISFKKSDQIFVSQFAYFAGVAIERALMLRNVVLKMIGLSRLRDPKETSAHVSRVGSYAIEIYQKWAKQNGVHKNEINNYKDVLKISAMVHDVGKVGISDAILKKPAKLTKEEFNTMKFHTIYGARLFDNSLSEWEKMAKEITLNHHEKWDGSGYPGKITDINDDNITFKKGKKGSETPLSSRIVALADVYDALVSQRVYKAAWKEEKALNYIKQQSGKHFDPELVSIFFEMYDVIKAIRGKWVD